MKKEYPIIIEGKETGYISVEEKGIMTEFYARCRDEGRILRLSLFGECEGYLGVMTPDGGGNMLLKKRMSRAAMSDFPKQIECAGESGTMRLRYLRTDEENEEAVKPVETNEPEQAFSETENTDEDSDCEDLLWMTTPEGFLVAFLNRARK